jgi:2-polyprenyl-3-methyl-5-hydroxy-6-metoxy-1,4-benzoquinol methylase
MGAQERLSLEAIRANTLIACAHVHRYRLAAALCSGLRVVDLACGSGYGSVILRETASSVVGVDNDPATIETARATVGGETGIHFEVADAVEYLQRGLHDHNAIVCLEGIEHLADLDAAVDALAALARGGMRLVISVPNSRTFAEENEFHITDFGYDEAMEFAKTLGGATVLYQFLAEGSLIRGEEPGPLDAEGMLQEHGEPAFANHFIACVNLGDRLDSTLPPARMQLAAAPAYNRHMLALERANRELWRENGRLVRDLGIYGDRNLSLEAEVDHLRHRGLLLDTPRHLAVERARDALMRSRLLYGVVRRGWAFVRSRW